MNTRRAHREDEVMEPLRHESRPNTMVAHWRAHLIEEIRFSHVVAVHDHEDVRNRDVLGLCCSGVDLIEYDVVQVG
jgi:hypothetical protein